DYGSSAGGDWYADLHHKSIISPAFKERGCFSRSALFALNFFVFGLTLFSSSLARLAKCWKRRPNILRRPPMRVIAAVYFAHTSFCGCSTFGFAQAPTI